MGPTNGAGVVELGWKPSPSSNVAGYEVLWGYSSSPWADVLDVGNVTNVAVGGLNSNTCYRFAVLAYSGSGSASDPSEEIVYCAPGGSLSNYPILTVSAPVMGFTTTQGNSPPSQVLAIWNNGGGTLNWAAVADGTPPAWLTVNPASGSGSAILTVSAAGASLPPGIYSRNITVTADSAINSPQTITAYLTVSGSGTVHYDFTYPDRASLLAAGWDFLARTASGAVRNTEQTSGAVVSYDQVAHPGLLRIPVDTGDLWGNMNDTRNTVFRNLPTDWTSLRLKIASFAPTLYWQQAGLAVYQDDDNYVYVDRIYNGGQSISSSRDVAGVPSIMDSDGVSARTNLYFRLDRQAGDVISAYYSLDGTSWVLSGTVTQALSNPRLGIITASSPSGFPNADIAWAEVIAPQTGPVLLVSPASLSFSASPGVNPPSQVISIGNIGSGTLKWTAVAESEAPAWLTVSTASGSGSAAVSVSAASASLPPGIYTKNITITADGAINSPQTVTAHFSVFSPFTIQRPRFLDGRFEFDLPTGAGLSYTIEYKDSLDDSVWTALTTLVGTGSTIPVTISTLPTGSRFYRVRLP